VKEVHVLLPEDIDDPARPSGGNRYDRRVCDGLAALGWTVHERPVPGDWPRPGPAGHAALARAVAQVPDDGIALVDGLIASPAPGALVPHARRLRQVVLVHMPLGSEEAGGAAARALEGEVLAAARAVVTTSAWTRTRLAELYGLPAARVHVAEPGVDPVAPRARVDRDRDRVLLCVAAVTPAKGHDLLLEALAPLGGGDWRLECVGSLEKDAAHAEAVGARARGLGLSAQVVWAGPRTGAALERAYADAGLLVLPSSTETYGMVVTEALAHGLPVVATAVGGVPEALGTARDGSRPGLLVPAGDAAALTAALRGWLTDAGLRERLRAAARDRRATLRGWPATSAAVAEALTGAAA
jgi:glycosyltransferase involved in cell wall biosynthesis